MQKWLKKSVEFVKQFVALITSELWNPYALKVRNHDAFVVRLIKVVAITVRGFVSNKVSLQASALTYYTIMSIVPLLAVIFAIAKGFGYYQMLLVKLSESFADKPDILEALTRFSESIMRVQGGWMAGVGVLLLLWTVLLLLSRIEASFNSIWQVTLPRPWMRRIPDYMAVVIVSPIFFLASSSMTVMINTMLDGLSKSYDELYLMWKSIRFLLNFANYFMIWIALLLLFKAMPNTKVKWGPALFGAVVAGSVLHLVQVFYIFSQVTISKYGAIYGSFAAVPLFLVWAQTSWIIVLFGAELSFAWQNVNQFENDINARRLSISDARLVQISVLRSLSQSVIQEKGAMTSTQLSEQLDLPVRLVRAAVSQLLISKFITEVLTDDPKVNAYIPIVDVHKLRLYRCIEVLEQSGVESIMLNHKPEVEKVNVYLSEIRKSLEESKLNVKLIDI